MHSLTHPSVRTVGAASTHVVPAQARRWDTGYEYERMQLVYGCRGGVLSGDQALARCRVHRELSVSSFAKQIVERKLVSYSWRHQLLLPAFQFDLFGRGPEETLIRVLDELRDTFDDWDIAVWFSCRNGWLQGQLPVDIIEQNGGAVIDAARADRFVRVG